MPDPFDKTDEAIARKLAEVTPPADLRARLLALDTNIEEAPSVTVNWWSRGIGALAALLVVTLTILSLWPTPSKREPLAAATSDMAAFLSAGFDLEMKTPDVGKVKSWLAEKHPNHPVALPALLAQNDPIGCRDIFWRGHVGSLACFKMKNGMEAHLAMFPEKTFSDAPGTSPKLASAGAWTSASWSKDGMTYILFVPTGMDPMKELAVLANHRSGPVGG
jgi:hypothetical protein